ncbi:MAG: hypothetical protein AB8B87_22620 [Granulosicoccus sp.]
MASYAPSNQRKSASSLYIPGAGLIEITAKYDDLSFPAEVGIHAYCKVDPRLRGITSLSQCHLSFIE